MSLGDIVAETRRVLEDFAWEDALNGSVIAGESPITVDSSGAWEEGDVGEFQDDGEVFYVESDATASSVSVKRAHKDTGPSSAHNDNVVILKNPRYLRTAIDKAIDRAVDELYPTVFEVKNTTLTPDLSGTVVYDVPSDFLGFVDLVQVATGDATDVRRVGHVREHWNLPSATWSSEVGLEIRGWPRDDVDGTLTYKARVTTATTDTQLRRLVALGAGVKLLAAEAGRKVDRAGDREDRPRRILFTKRELEDEFDSLRHGYMASILPKWGPVKRFRRKPRTVRVV